MSQRNGRLALTAACIVAAVSTSVTLAQPFRGGDRGDNLFDPAVSTNQMERYAAILELTGDQHTAALALLEAYHLEFQAAAQPVRTRIEALRDEARETRDRAIWGEIMEAREAFNDQADKMEEAFLADVQSLLSPQQAETGWPRVERARRRELSIPRGLMSGERVDVIALVTEMKLAEEQAAALQDTLTQYELELDLALVKRDQVQDEFRDSMRDMFRSGDQEGLADMFERSKQAATKVRDINNRFARQIEAQLAPEHAPVFAEQVRRRGFPMIYRPSYAESVLGTAEKFTDLAPEQKDSLGTIRATFDKDLTSINRQMETAQVRMEETMTPDRMMNMWRGGGGENNELRDLRERRRELERSTVDLVRSVLNEEQVARLPERGQREEEDGRPRRGAGRQRGPGGGDGAQPDGQRGPGRRGGGGPT